MKRKIIAVIPASGVGSRMQAEKPKQYLQLKGKTILEHTVSIFLEHPHVEKVIVAVARKDPFYSTLELLKSPKIQLVFGGETRADSVLNALQEINTENAWALVHDAARPCLKRSDLDKLLQINDPQGGILAIPAVDTMKRANGTKIAHTEDRSTLWHALTPQFFPAQALKQALSSAFANKLQVTDEASAMELAGYQPQLVSGRSDNIKITRPEDLALAEFYLTHNLEN
ncbi:TPA: 2-C-methyl-D-erythritol 4-phosphate cytidylyltransferase [Mannheimia haemolytica]|uniref:2-C-methyl-D-erythritol 4-phosphate cytidylyltransferase n=1 Tax=Mannheimia haemolytica TaxID=75985 RepID=A0A249A223_MANHA|nr:2-C-methyl-D-erythritol 4-phosphate cytidylyltransferase [Mannheimia haemolytica]AWW71783.1 2-C-methyl-D-erythritol 4-phosphate cytidylyltransferase [Pasteurellaceae bacterium 12565]AGI33012.2 2-C-methyl-D-erythritol 4-phosphate cytidylyltransferase [Mannheimia haemolytica USDA-ARS-USMARC-183]AGI35018.2 2-C-methyl-D-erythritol 4-phosphate cytidylyltransferase [Mannheimia haemolytica USDA-ARS-USMARC-185]AGK02067.1 2-C-methyl-D-erythritol 4-phosphate cytidylyltransferase IspD [Mannheimia haemo